MDPTFSIIKLILGDHYIPYNIFLESFEMKNIKICTYIMNQTYEPFMYESCRCMMSYFFLETCGSVEKYVEPDNSCDEFGNSICDIELIKWLFRSNMYKFSKNSFEKHVSNADHINYERNILQYCMTTGVLDLVKISYVHFISFNSSNLIKQFIYPFLYGYKDIMQWMYEIRPLECKLQFESLFKLINKYIMINKITKLKLITGDFIVSPEKFYQIISTFVEIFDDVELEKIYQNKLGTIYEQPIHILTILSEEDKIWRKSLRCVWISACKSIELKKYNYIT
jgi:hypothetical protein